jgi:hypothetical protein
MPYRSLAFIASGFGAALAVMHFNDSAISGNPKSILLRTIALEVFVLLMAVTAISLTLQWKRKRRIVNFVFLFATTIIFLSSMEVIFSFVPRSHGVGYTFAARLWFEKYWRPINSLGYRDKEIAQNDLSKIKVAVVGDSFMAGHGVKDVRDRFSDVLQAKLGAQYRVFNLGLNGADTRSEFDSLSAFPYKSDIIVLSYCGNDIDKVSLAMGTPSPEFTPYKNLGSAARYMVEHSFFFNYLYWLMPQEDSKNYDEFLFSSYRNPEILKAHLSDLKKFVDFARLGGSKLFVLLFPYDLRDLEGTKSYVQPVKDEFLAENVPVLDVSEIATAIRPSDRTVNSSDGHPSPALHRLIAESFYARFFKGATTAPTGIP